MLGLEIKNFFDTHEILKNHFQGVYKIENCPVLNVREAAVLHLNNHWIAVIRSSKNLLEVKKHFFISR